MENFTAEDFRKFLQVLLWEESAENSACDSIETFSGVHQQVLGFFCTLNWLVDLKHVFSQKCCTMSTKLMIIKQNKKKSTKNAQNKQDISFHFAFSVHSI